MFSSPQFLAFFNFYISPSGFQDVIMLTGYRIISIQIELDKFIPIFEKNHAFLNVKKEFV